MQSQAEKVYINVCTRRCYRWNNHAPSCVRQTSVCRVRFWAA